MVGSSSIVLLVWSVQDETQALWMGRTVWLQPNITDILDQLDSHFIGCNFKLYFQLVLIASNIDYKDIRSDNEKFF